MPAAPRSGAAPPRSGLRHPKQERRSLALTYLLWCLGLLGVCGLQRFYNRKPLSGLLWLFSFGLCGLGQLVDLLLIPSLVEQANQPLLLAQALSQLEERQGPSLERQLLLLARRAGPEGFTINDALVELDLPHSISSAEVSAEIERLLHAELLDVGNDQRGRVVYREP
ncbi:MAG: TM2 domain-containing protein [Synechococcaceae cyanobacterium]|jgi:TM2 domain-containing membrane protein YozV